MNKGISGALAVDKPPHPGPGFQPVSGSYIGQSGSSLLELRVDLSENSEHYGMFRVNEFSILICSASSKKKLLKHNSSQVKMTPYFKSEKFLPGQNSSPPVLQQFMRSFTMNMELFWRNSAMYFVGWWSFLKLMSLWIHMLHLVNRSNIT